MTEILENVKVFAFCSRQGFDNISTFASKTAKVIKNEKKKNRRAAYPEM